MLATAGSCSSATWMRSSPPRPLAVAHGDDVEIWTDTRPRASLPVDTFEATQASLVIADVCSSSRWPIPVGTEFLYSDGQLNFAPALAFMVNCYSALFRRASASWPAGRAERARYIGEWWTEICEDLREDSGPPTFERRTTHDAE
jgi:hypothetical protein